MVSAYWAFDVVQLPHEGFVHRVWPDGCVSLLIACVGDRPVASVIRGVTRDPHDVPVRAGTRYRGVRLRPECGAAFLGVPAASLLNVNPLAAELLGDAVHPLATAIARCTTDAEAWAVFDAWIGSRLAAMREPLHVDHAVQRAVTHCLALDGQVTVRALAEHAGVHERTLQRRFLDAVGLTPKQFAQVRRARAAMRLALGDPHARPEWSALAAQGGFADQSHLSREMTRHTHLTPGQLKARLDSIAHEEFVD